MDLIEAVIDLAPNLFYGTGLAACILILRRRKDPLRAVQVLIVDASQLFRKARAQNFLEPEHTAEILGWYQDFTEVKDRARVVSLEEIAEEDWTLNIYRYVLPPIGEDIPPLDEAIADFKLRNPTVLIVVDRIDLDAQISATFHASDIPNLVKAESRDELERLLRQDTRKIIITTIFKFGEAEGELNDRDNIIVMVDEAHRFYGRRIMVNYIEAENDSQRDIIVSLYHAKKEQKLLWISA